MAGKVTHSANKWSNHIKLHCVVFQSAGAGRVSRLMSSSVVEKWLREAVRAIRDECSTNGVKQVRFAASRARSKAPGMRRKNFVSLIKVAAVKHFM